jgi:LysR family glycine cleavage system transcriptional activator
MYMDLRALPSTSVLKAFLAVAQEGSFHGAATVLSVSSSAVSHQISALETRFGVRLFERTGRKVALTESGQYFYNQALPHVLGIIECADRFTNSAREQSTVTVSSAPSFAAKILIPNLGGLKHDLPHVRIRVEASGRYDFDSAPTDIEVSYGYKADPEKTIVPLFSEQILPLCSPAFLNNSRRRPRLFLRPQDLLQLPLICSESNIFSWVEWFERLGLKGAAPTFALRFDRAAFSISAAANGLGTALESSVLAEDELRAGRLVPACNPPLSLRATHYFASARKARLQTREVRATFEWLAQLSTSIQERSDGLLVRLTARAEY